MSTLRIAFLGLGLMGSGMAHRLLAAGFAVTVFNRHRDKAASHAAAGASIATTPRVAAADADVILSMVADDSAGRAVWLGADGALGAIRPSTIAIECSTVTLDWIQELKQHCSHLGVDLLDAPVTGSRTHAAAGELNFLVGGSAHALDKVRPVLAVMSKTITHLGPVGSGVMMKLINNFVCGVQIAALAEATAMIERSGLNRDSAIEILTGGAPGSPLVKAVSARMTLSDYAPHFLLRLMAKDIRYAMRTATALSLHLGTAQAALEVFQRGIDAGLGESDMAAVIEPLRTI